MATDSKKYTAAWLYSMLLIGTACGAVIYYFLKPDPCKGCCPDPKDPPPLAMTGFFDRASVESLVGAPGGWGGRFYLCDKGGGELTVLSGAIKEDGEHIPDATGELRFLAYKGISGAATDMTVLNEERAEAAVKAASTAERPAFAIDVRNEVLADLLGATSANGIGLQARRTASRDWSFELGPVTLRDGAAYVAGAAGDVVLGAYPCPMYCPKEPAFYLHMR